MNDLAADLTRSLDPENPWPGLMPFTEATQAYFHGRDAEAAELLRRVWRERLTILFGQSGLGKTSLLCAGAFPRLRTADFLPVYIRLDWTTTQISPIAQIKKALAENLAEHGIEGHSLSPDETLWGYFHGRETEFWSRRNQLVTPVLVLDQFEEIFTLGPGATSAETFDELAALIENRPPESVRSALNEDPEAATRYDFAKESCKVILALREDFLPDLEGLRRRIPSIIENRMRLTRMDGRQARDAILASGSHLVAPGVAEKVIAFVAASRVRTDEATRADDRELANLEIEPALLSIVCSELNNKRIRLGQAQITANLLEGAQQEIVGQFYESSLAGIDPALKLFIEEQLLTSEGYRDSRPVAEALREPGVTRAHIDTLVLRRLLRIEERFATQWVELTHDLLTGVIRQQRDLRREQTAAEARVRAEREQAARRLVRRTRIALVATVLLLLVTVGAMGWAVIEQRRADDRAKEAEQSYKLALDAANGDVEIVDQNYKAGKIGSEVARALLDRARSTFGGLPSTGEKATTTRARIYLFSTLAETYLTFGDLKAARKAAQTERSLADQFANPGPAELHDLSDSHNKLGEVLKRQGDLAGALDEYRESLSEMKGLADKESENNQWQRKVAEAHRNIGDVLSDRGNLTGALDERRASVAILDRLAAKDPTNRSWQRDLAKSHCDVSTALRARDDLAGSFVESESGLAIMMQLIGIEPNNADWQWKLAACQDAVGEALRVQGNLADALKQFDSNIKMFTELATKDPANAQWQRDLAVTHNKIGMVQEENGDLDKAWRETTKAADIFARLAERDPVNAGWQRDLAVSYGWIGAVLLDQHDWDKAFDKYHTYLEMMTELVAKDLSNSDWQSLLADAHEGIGSAREARRELDEALSEYEAALKIREQLVAQDHDNAEWEHALVYGHNYVGRVRKALGARPEALDEFRAGLRVIDREVPKDPGNAIWQHSLSQAHLYIGRVLSEQGDSAGSLKELRAGEEILTTLVNKDPTEDHRQTRNVWLQDLAFSHNDIGRALEGQDNPDLPGAIEEYRAELATKTALTMKDPENSRWRHDLADGHERLGWKLEAQDDPAGALTEFRARAEILTELVKKDPSNTDWQQQLAYGHNEVASILETQHDLKAAIEEYKAELTIRSARAMKDPDNRDWQHDLVDGHNRLAKILQAQADFPGALTEFRGAEEILTKLVEQDPTDTDRREELATSHNEIGRVLEAQNDLAAALAEYQAEFATRKALAAADPENSSWQHDLAASYGNKGRVLLAKGDDRAAATEIQAGVAGMARLAALDPTNMDWQQDLAELHRESGDTAKAASDATGARSEYEACVGIAEPMVSSDSRNQKLTELAAYCRSQITAAESVKGRAETTPGPMP